MSTQNNEQARTANTLLIAIGISLLLAIVFVNAASPVNVEVTGSVAMVETPTNTPQPPTSAPLPSDTPVPTITYTPLPTATTVVPPTSVPESVTEVAVNASTTDDNSFDPILAAEGENLFLAGCTACHGADARGLPNLGKDLVESEFIKSQTDEELLTFVKTGRPLWDAANTTGIDMPAKGGNPALTDDNIVAIIAYMRSLAAASGGGAPSGSSESSDGQQTIAAAFDPALATQGESIFMAACTACHGPDGRGLPNLGKDLVESEFMDSQTDEELLTFVKTGRPLWDAANTTGIDMPAKGGNPALTDDDIFAIIAYLRSLAVS